LEYTLINLKRNGINEAVVNLSYKPEQIQSYFKDGARWGMKIHYSIEKKLMGTAGGVKKAEKIFLNDPDPDFLITSGDGLTDINLKKIIEFHKKKKSFGTIALKAVETRFEYGVTITDKRGRIKKFVEKPLWGDVFSNEVNTGIYLFNKKVFNLIPQGQFYDFGHQLWPKLLKFQKPIYGYKFSNFWNDIGNVKEYREAQKAVLEKKVNFQKNAREVKPNVWIGKGVKVEKGVKFVAPCLIGDDCFIGKNATIGAHSAIGSHSIIGEKAVVKNSVLWNRVRVGDGAFLDGCVIGKGEKISKNCSFFEGILLDTKK
jgi:mannose-1-phosphate guanylyltransferase/phosphomannomutase